MMKRDNSAIGNYLAQKNKLGIQANDRDEMIKLIQGLHRKKDGYKPETMHLAGNIADKYLSYLTRKGKRAPNLAMLATTAILMAAKLEQPISPSFNRMISLLPAEHRYLISKDDLIDLEE